MIDFTFTQGSLALALYCMLFYALLIIPNYRTCTDIDFNDGHSNNARFFFFLGVLVYSVSCSINGDFYHYQDIVKNYDFTPGARNHGEVVYKYIIAFVNKNYMLFRVIVWGGALVLFWKTLKRLEIDNYKVTFFMVATYILVFSYARSSLAMSLYFFGVSYIIKPNTYFSYIYGLTFILASFFFHHSIIVAIALTPVIWINLTPKKIIIIAILSSAILFLYPDFVENTLMKFLLSNNEELYNQIDFYSKREVESINWKGAIYEFSGYATFFFPFFVCVKTIYFNNETCIDKKYEKLFRIVIGLTMVAMGFLLLDLQGKVFFYRILYMTFIPLSIIVCHLVINGLIEENLFKKIINVGIFAQMYRLLYSIYLYL